MVSVPLPLFGRVCEPEVGIAGLVLSHDVRGMNKPLPFDFCFVSPEMPFFFRVEQWVALLSSVLPWRRTSFRELGLVPNKMDYW